MWFDNTDEKPSSLHDYGTLTTLRGHQFESSHNCLTTFNFSCLTYSDAILLFRDDVRAAFEIGQVTLPQFPRFEISLIPVFVKMAECMMVKTISGPDCVTLFLWAAHRLRR